jgi:ferrochelatase
LVVVCPAFVADCLETLEEIGMQGRETFLKAGGESFTLIPCLNTHPLFVEALADWSMKFNR